MIKHINEAAQLMRTARRAVALTGAGLSTESGIPDFRGPGGVWERFRRIHGLARIARCGASAANV